MSGPGKFPRVGLIFGIVVMAFVLRFASMSTTPPVFPTWMFFVSMIGIIIFVVSGDD